LLYLSIVTPYRTPPAAKSADLPAVDDSRVALVLLAFFLCAVVATLLPGVPNDADDHGAGRGTLWHHGEGGAGHGGGGHR